MMTYARKDCSHLTLHNISTLFGLCSSFISNNTTAIHGILEKLPEKQKQIVFNLLPLNIPLDVSIPIIIDEMYWKRKCLEKGWNYVDYWLSNCSWRKTFIFSYVEILIECYICEKISFEKLEEDLMIFQHFCEKLKINGCNWNSFDSDECHIIDKNIFEAQLENMFILLHHLEEFNINIIPRNYENGEASANAKADAFILMLLKNLSKFKKLQKFIICGTYIGPNEVKQLMNNICLEELQELRLSCCFISDISCELVPVLFSSSKLQKLTLCNNNIGKIGSRILSTSLRDNSSLIELDLSKNCIDNDAVISLMVCLESNECLKKLDLSYNKFNEDSGGAFCSLIQNNKSLCCLNLSGNFMGEDAGIQIAHSMNENKNILIFGVQFCGFRKCDEDSINIVALQNNERQY